MYPFKAHLKEFNFLLNQVFHLSQIWAETPDLNEIIDLDLGQSVLEEASKFIAQKIYPLNCSGDKKGVVLILSKFSRQMDLKRYIVILPMMAGKV